MAKQKDKAKPVRSNDYIPKAGPKSHGGGRGKQKSAETIAAIELRNGKRQPLSFSGRGRATGTHTRSSAKAKADAYRKQLEQEQFREKQAQAAGQDDRLAKLGKAATVAAFSLFVEFLEATPERDKQGKVVKTRTQLAEAHVLASYSMEEYEQSKADIEYGLKIAKRALTTAYNTVQAAQAAPKEQVA